MFTFLMALLSTQTAYASSKAGEATVKEGYTTTIELASTYQRTLQQSTVLSYNWRSDNTDYVIVTYSNKNQATIKGINPTKSCRVYYFCSYLIDGFYRTFDFYYDITVTAATVYVTKVELSHSSATLEEGETLLLNEYVYPANATNRHVNWSTSKAAVATVNSYGLVTAKSEGTATISCYAADGSGCHATCRITVKAAEVMPTSISLNTSKEELNEGETLQLNAIITPDEATNTRLTWISDNPSIATVSANGLVSAIKEGSANIIVTTANNLAAVCTITVTTQKPATTTDWSGSYTVSSSHITSNPSIEYADNFGMEIEYNGKEYLITSMFGENIARYNDGGLILKDNGDGTATIDISYYNVLKYTNYDSPLYALYVYNEATEEWIDTWTLTMNDDGSISVQDFHVVTFTWVEENEIWDNGKAEALYYDMIANINDNTNAIYDTNMEKITISTENKSIVLSEMTEVSVYHTNGTLIYSRSTRQIDNLQPGIYIVRFGKQSTKVVIR